ncbi:MAG: hypothetical protein AB7S26_25605 [Sandaracinaceae bacterium]
MSDDPVRLLDGGGGADGARLAEVTRALAAPRGLPPDVRARVRTALPGREAAPPMSSPASWRLAVAVAAVVLVAIAAWVGGHDEAPVAGRIPIRDTAEEGRSDEVPPDERDASESDAVAKPDSDDPTWRAAGGGDRPPRRPPPERTLAAITRVVADHRAQFLGCIDRRAAPPVPVRVTLALTIKPNGEVRDVVVERAGPGSVCVAAEAQRLRFPLGPSESTVRIPLVLEPAD